MKALPPLTQTHPHLIGEWHPTRNGSLTPDKVNESSNVRAWWICNADQRHEWQFQVTRRARFSAGCPLCEIQDSCLAVLRPEIAREWHPTLNGDLTPLAVTTGSSRKVWWQCISGHDYQITIAEKVLGRICPQCVHIQAVENSLCYTHPHLAAEWHPTKNDNLTPRDVSFGSKALIWWRCTEEPTHVWQATILKRTNRKQTCPFCRGYYPDQKTSLAALFPEIASEWHPTKNRMLRPDIKGSFQISPNLRIAHAKRNEHRRLRPSDVSTHSKEKIWWRCRFNKAHEWQAEIYRRVAGSQCPYCCRQKISADTSLTALVPSLAKMWHPTRNLPLLPSAVGTGSKVKVWWRCPKHADHVFQQWIHVMVDARRTGRLGCPICTGRHLSKDNCLAVKKPEVAKLWHPERNTLSPFDVTPNADKKVWWRCPRNEKHEWTALVSAVTNHLAAGHRGCPFCSHRRVTADDNLSVQYPEVAKLWQKQMNMPLRVTQVSHGSSKFAWWRCPKDGKHIWRARISSMVRSFVHGTTGCPLCLGKPAKNGGSSV